MRPVRTLASCLTLLALLGAARAEELDLPGLFDSAKASFGEKKYGRCLGDLTLIAAEVGRLRVEGLSARMAAPPAGWTADDAEGQASAGLPVLGAMTLVRRRYARGEGTEVTAEAYADAGAVRGTYDLLLQNAALMGGAGVKVVTVKGRKAIEQHDGSNRSGSLTVLLRVPGSLLKLDGSGVAKEDLHAVAGAFDLDALEKALAE